MVGKREWGEAENRFKALGLDRVYSPEVGLDKAIEDLKANLRLLGKM
jgi:methylmalonyl-CoA mutase cobalamin-binding subunit